MALHPLNGIELFSGTGMLGEGFRAGIDYLGIPYRTVCHVEREAYPAAVLVARMEEGSMDAAPIWPDVTTFDASAWRGKVDCIIAGFPCQDLSVAGRRAGLDGKRSGLFFEVTRIATDSGAWLMLLENVAGIATATATVMDPEEGELDERAASRVVGELADLGWDAEWITLSASDVGASHGRARWFCIAWRVADTKDGRFETWRESIGVEQKQPVIDGGSSNVANPEGRGIQRKRIELARGAEVEGAGETVGNTNQQREQQPHHADGAESWEWSRTCTRGAGGIVAYPCSLRSPSRISGPDARQEGNASIAIHGGDVTELAHPNRPRLERLECGRGTNSFRGGGNRMDQLANAATYSPLAQATQDGQTSSATTPNSRLHLNPLFGCKLMGWPSTWVIAEPHASSASETVLWRCNVRQQLSYLLDEQDSPE